ncbi:hypothetical protein AAD018_005515 [Aestuariibius insulae]|uniref:hypothetical protein n=1 Tax=Aestuariibius insulae TaxID=2058287 RepID=UPI003494163A
MEKRHLTLSEAESDTYFDAGAVRFDKAGGTDTREFPLKWRRSAKNIVSSATESSF